MARKTVIVRCKNCGKEFSYSEEAYNLKAEEGQDKPERCNECAKSNKREINGADSPYIPFKKGNKEVAGFAALRGKLAF